MHEPFIFYGVAYNFNTFYRSTFGETRVKADGTTLPEGAPDQRKLGLTCLGPALVGADCRGDEWNRSAAFEFAGGYMILSYSIVAQLLNESLFRQHCAFGAQTKHDSDKVMFPSARSVLVASSCIVANFRRPSIFWGYIATNDIVRLTTSCHSNRNGVAPQTSLG